MNTIQQYGRLLSKLPNNVNLFTIIYPDRESYENKLELVKYPELKNVLDLRLIPGFKYYDNMRENEHHITIDSSLTATELILNKLFGNGILFNKEFQKEKFQFTHPNKRWFPGIHEFNTFQPINQEDRYKYFDDFNNYIGNWSQACCYNRPRGHWTNQYTPYHRFFTGAHRIGNITNLNSKSERRIGIIADSFGIPVIPYIAYFCKEVRFYDNRSNEPRHFELSGLTDMIVLCYERNLFDDNNAFYRSMKLIQY